MTKAQEMKNIMESAKMMLEFSTKQELIDNLHKVCMIDNAGDIAYRTIFEQYMSMSAVLHPSVAIDNIIAGIEKHADHYNASK